MMERKPAGTAGTWSVPQCPIAVEYSKTVLDDIRLAVTDAFFSLPRGGAEIGGILLGRHEGGRVTIDGFAPLDCEHASGPSFTLSERDHQRLAELLAVSERNPAGLRPVGWYHSHTRSEIFLTEADCAIHDRYFPEPWHLALVLRPHTFHPTRGGFFFREADGKIHAQASYREFTVEPQPMAPVPERPAMQERVEMAPVPVRRLDPDGPARQMPAPFAVAAVPAPQPPTPQPTPVENPPVEERLPSFAQVQPQRSWRWAGVVLAIAAGVALGAAAYQTREIWLRSAVAWSRPKVGTPATQGGVALGSMGLRTLDTEGQLWIVWDRNSALIRNASRGTLVIHDGPLTHGVDLDAAHLATGSFTYGRQSERVDVELTVTEANGDKPREVTTYLGRLPGKAEVPQAQPAPISAAERQKMAAQLNAERARSKKLEKSLSDAVTKLKKADQLKRMENQNADRK
jgi:proteasome lid subunit RPN8/RPN11